MKIIKDEHFQERFKEEGAEHTSMEYLICARYYGWCHGRWHQMSKKERCMQRFNFTECIKAVMIAYDARNLCTWSHHLLAENTIGVHVEKEIYFKTLLTPLCGLARSESTGWAFRQENQELPVMQFKSKGCLPAEFPLVWGRSAFGSIKAFNCFDESQLYPGVLTHRINHHSSILSQFGTHPCVC